MKIIKKEWDSALSKWVVTFESKGVTRESIDKSLLEAELLAYRVAAGRVK